MFSCHSVSKQFQSSSVLKDASLHIRNGEAVGLLGTNGAGKSTWIKSMLQLIHPDSGHTDFDSPVAYLPEQPVLPPTASAYTLLQLQCNIHQLPDKQIEASLSMVGLDKVNWYKPTKCLSKGMRQRVSIAWVLCNSHAKNIILDEPMSGLDALGRAQMLDCFLQQKNRGVAILMCSHIVTDMVQLCDRVLILHQGQVCEEVVLEHNDMDEVHLLEQKLSQWSST